jgi:hypothetical protein
MSEVTSINFDWANSKGMKASFVITVGSSGGGRYDLKQINECFKKSKVYLFDTISPDCAANGAGRL